jgi:WD40 repeat protein
MLKKIGRFIFFYHPIIGLPSSNPISIITPSITLTGHNDTVCSVVWSPDSNYIATGSYDNTAKIWDSQNGTLLHTLSHNGPVYSVAWSPDSSQISADNSPSPFVATWNAQNGSFLHTSLDYSVLDSNSQCSFRFKTPSPDGTRIATIRFLDKTPKILKQDGTLLNILTAITTMSIQQIGHQMALTLLLLQMMEQV